MLVDLLRQNVDEVNGELKGSSKLLHIWMAEYGLYTDLYYTLLNLSKRGQTKADIRFEIVDSDLFLNNNVRQTVCYIDNVNIGAGHLGFMQTDISNDSIYEIIKQLQTYIHMKWGCAIQTKNKLEFEIIWNKGED